MVKLRIFPFCHFLSVIVLVNCYQGTNDNTPTISPAEDFDAVGDALRLQEILSYDDTEEAIEKIMDMLLRVPLVQRHKIAKTYEILYFRKLMQELETFGISSILDAVMSTLPDYYAKVLHDAITSRRIRRGDDIVEVLCPQTDMDINEIFRSYQNLYGRSFKSELQADETEMFIYELCVANRFSSLGINETRAASTARKIFKKETQSMWFTDLFGQNHEQIRQTFLEYEKLFGHDLTNALRAFFTNGGVDEYFLIAIATSIVSKNEYFAGKLYINSFMDPKVFIRILISRSEIDLGNIKEVFQERYRESLANFIGMPGIPKFLKPLISSPANP